MASSQREAERAERKKAKSRKRWRIAWAIVGVAVAALLIMRIAETDFSSLSAKKNNSESVSEKTNILMSFPPAAIFHSERWAAGFMCWTTVLSPFLTHQTQALCKPLITAIPIP